MSVVSHLITGDWRYLAEDGIVDLDDLPDEVLPSGRVEFTPVSPKVAFDGDPSVAYTLAPVQALVEAGQLAVRLVGQVGGQVVRWRAVVVLEYLGTPLPRTDTTFDLDEDKHLTGVSNG